MKSRASITLTMRLKVGDLLKTSPTYTQLFKQHAKHHTQSLSTLLPATFKFGGTNIVNVNVYVDKIQIHCGIDYIIQATLHTITR